MSYWHNRISDGQAMHIATTFTQILGEIVLFPKKRVDELDLCSDYTRDQLQKWNLNIPSRVEKCIDESLAEHAINSPSAPAVHGWDANFSYQELNNTSTRLAHHLRAVGVGPNVKVPICFEKSTWAIVVMYAILKAGGAFVPLDPSHPISRLQGIISKTGARVMLVSPNAPELTFEEEGEVIVVSTALIDQLPNITNKVYSDVQPEHPAYVIFTSGSTGEPKGVVVSHVALSTSSSCHGRAMGFEYNSRVLQFSSYVFDVSITEIFTTIVYGGCICVPSEEDRMSNLAQTITRMGVTWAFLTPSLVSLIEPASVPSLKTLAIGGEMLLQDIIETWANRIELINAYGPAECCVFCVTSEKLSLTSRPEEIGHPVGSVGWIVDPKDSNRLMPIGSIGELVVEGPILASGYLNMPSATASVFIDNPSWISRVENMSSLPRRMYKTGDLVRYDSTGTINFISRKDRQVKFHGQRIELDEIEYHLGCDARIRHGIVLAPKNGRLAKKVVVALTLRGTSTGSKDEILQLLDGPDKIAGSMKIDSICMLLSEKVPHYMVPSTWLAVNEIPLLSSGKLDRKKVSRWIEEISEEDFNQSMDSGNKLEDTTIMPATLIERQLQSIWSEVLNLPSEKIGLNQSFLTLGGDSISAMQVISLCRKNNFGLTVQDVLRIKTISELALRVTSVNLSVYKEEEMDQPFDLSPVQQLYFESFGTSLGRFNQSFFLKLTRHISSDTVQQAIQALVVQHSMLRARFARAEGGSWRQRITRDTAASYMFQSYSLTSLEEIKLLIAESQASINIEEGPLLIVNLFNIEGQEQTLFLVAHHLVIDLVSWRALLQDLEQLLESGSLPPRPLPFQVWTKLQAENARSQTMNHSKMLPYLVPTANIVYWGMDGQKNTYTEMIHKSFSLDDSTSALLMGPCHQTMNTEPVDIFLAALIHSFTEVFSDREPITVYNESHGREPWDANIDISRTIGWFTSLYPLYVAVESTDILRTVRSVKDTRRSIPANGRPYFAHRYHTEDGKERFKAHSAMELIFNYLGQYQQLERSDSLLQLTDIECDLEADLGLADFNLEATRLGLLDVVASVTKGKVQFEFSYNLHMKHQDLIEKWIAVCKNLLQIAATELLHSMPTPTLSDFPLLRLTYVGLEQLQNEILPQVGLTSFTEIEDIYQCSPLQEGLLLSQSRNASFYAVESIFEVKLSTAGQNFQRLSLELLTSAWQKVVNRHSPLRTIFVPSVSGGLFNQIVVKQSLARIKFINGESKDAISTLLAQEPIDYTKPLPPYQLTLYLGSNDTVFCKMEMSHAIIDGGSISILFRDLALAYEGRLTTTTVAKYSDYIEYIQNQSSQTHLEYWKKYLSDVQPTHFPTLNQVPSTTRQLQTTRIGFDAISQLQEFVETRSLTLSNVLQTTWGLVLRSYTGINDICFGYLASGRDTPIDGMETAVGAFINMLICRMNLTDTSSVQGILEQAQTDFVQSIPHQHCSLAQVQHELHLSGVSLFNTAMSFQKVTAQNEKEILALSFEKVTASDPSEVCSITFTILHFRISTNN